MATLARLDIVVSARSGNTRGLNGATRGLQTMERQADRTDKKLLTLGNTLKVAVAIEAARRIARVTGAIFDLGASVDETQSKFSTVFAQSTRDVQEFLDVYANNAGLTNREAQELLSTTGAIAQGMGFAIAASAEYAQTVARLAADISSFNNVAGGAGEVIEAINAAAAGEREQLKKWGIVILDVDVKQQALLETGKKLATQLTQEEKILATLTLISQRAGVAVGDLDRTQLSAANTARRVSARFRELKELLASAVVPIFAQLIGALDENSEAFDAIETAVLSVSKGIQTGIAVVQLFGVSMAVMAAKAEVGWAKVKDAAADALLRGGVAGVITRFSEWLRGLPPWVQGLLGIPGPVNPVDAVHGLAALVESDTEQAVRIAQNNLRRIEEAAEDSRQNILASLNASLSQTGASPLPTIRNDTPAEESARSAEKATIGMKKLREEQEKNIESVDRLQAAAARFTDDFAARLARVTTDGSEAFKGFADSVIAEINRILIKMALIKIVEAVAPGNSFLRAAVGAGPVPGLAPEDFVGNFKGLGHDTLGVASIAAPPQGAAAGGGPTYNVTVPLTVTAVDGKDAQRAVDAMRPQIAQTVVDVIRNSGAMQKVLG